MYFSEHSGGCSRPGYAHNGQKNLVRSTDSYYHPLHEHNTSIIQCQSLSNATSEVTVPQSHGKLCTINFTWDMELLIKPLLRLSFAALSSAHIIHKARVICVFNKVFYLK